MAVHRPKFPSTIAFAAECHSDSLPFIYILRTAAVPEPCHLIVTGDGSDPLSSATRRPHVAANVTPKAAPHALGCRQADSRMQSTEGCGSPAHLRDVLYFVTSRLGSVYSVMEYAQFPVAFDVHYACMKTRIIKGTHLPRIGIKRNI
jgi:hypothetical protein